MPGVGVLRPGSTIDGMSDAAGAAILVAAVVVAYGIGTFPTAHLVGRRLGFDPTTTGSGNPGASNTTRVGGLRAGAMVLVGDAGKGVLAAGLGMAVDGRTTAWIVGAAAVAGHMWPVSRGFRGGKGVATAAGVVLVGAPLVSLAMAAVFALVVKVVGKAAIGSLVIAVLLPVILAALDRDAVEVVTAAAIGLAIIVRHRSNIGRLWAGTESDVRP